MGLYILAASVVILLVAAILFLKKPGSGNSISLDDVMLLQNENQSLRIELATAKQYASGLIAEKESITNLLKEEKGRLLDELVYERSQLAAANQSLESARAYYKSQQEKIQEKKIEVDQ